MEEDDEKEKKLRMRTKIEDVREKERQEENWGEKGVRRVVLGENVISNNPVGFDFIND